MKDKAQRFKRIHDIRSKLADAAEAESRRLHAMLEQNRSQVSGVVEESAAALSTGGRDGSSWRGQNAIVQVAQRRMHQLAMEAGDLARELTLADAARAHALLAREQAARILDRTREAYQMEQDRREQARLDDIFAIALVRRQS